MIVLLLIAASQCIFEQTQSLATSTSNSTQISMPSAFAQSALSSAFPSNFSATFHPIPPSAMSSTLHFPTPPMNTSQSTNPLASIDNAPARKRYANRIADGRKNIMNVSTMYNSNFRNMNRTFRNKFD